MKRLLFSLLAVFAFIASGTSQTATSRARKSPGVVLNGSETKRVVIQTRQAAQPLVVPSPRTRRLEQQKALALEARRRAAAAHTQQVAPRPSPRVRTAAQQRDIVLEARRKAAAAAARRRVAPQSAPTPSVIVTNDDTPTKKHHKKWKNKNKQHHDNRNKSKHHDDDNHDNRGKSKHHDD